MNKYILTKNDTDLLTYLTLTGFPSFYRMRLWIIASGAFNQVKSNPDYYSKLLKLSEEVPSLYTDIIKKDLDRTNTKDEEIKKKLFKILLCFSIRNSSIGYCQGFNYIALKILEIVQDEVILYLFNIELLIKIGTFFLGFYYDN